MEGNRENWIAVLQQNGRYIVKDKVTNCLINDANGHGYTTELKCWNWIHNMQRQVGIYIEEPTPTYTPLF